MIKIEKKDQHVVEVFEGVIRRTLACGKDVLMARFEYEKDSHVPPHRHSYEQVTTVLKGEQKIIIKSEDEEKVIVIKEGDSFVVPSNFEHEQIISEESITIDAWSLTP
ncbi:MAG: cupin domain-containing protein [Candidatus Aminicenantes bacterium]|nr:cupin domain-containing protein [Candidatus Aminicenantes bacterium]MDH5744964.1 cupin domain-containing protein [Candidatus Aminicenantes bacterium]